MSSKRVAYVSQRYYPGDGRMTTAITALLEAGYEVDVFVMKLEGQKSREVLENGARMIRIPSMTRQRASKLRYLVEYFSFFTPMFFLLAVLQFVRGYKIVHITNLPDTLVFSALIPKLFGAKVIFDVRECTPEMFMDRFGGKTGGKAIRLMTAIEQAAIRFSNATVTCTDQMRKALLSRGANPDKVSVILNTARLPNVRPIAPPPADQVIDGTLRIITHGTVIKRYGHDVLIDAMALVVKEIPDSHLEIVGKGQWIPELKEQVTRLGLDKHITFSGFLPDEQLVDKIQSAHIAAVTLVQNPEADLVHTHKMFEYMQLAAPLVISGTTAVVSYFNEDTMRFFKPGDARSLADAILELARNPALRHSLAVNGLRVYEQCSIPKQRALYMNVVEGALGIKQTPKPELTNVGEAPVMEESLR